MLSAEGLQLLKDLLCYDPKKRISCDEALKADYFMEDPRPIDPSMFPTWPAKSEQEPGDKGKGFLCDEQILFVEINEHIFSLEFFNIILVLRKNIRFTLKFQGFKN